jgi:hypothetical protein
MNIKNCILGTLFLLCVFLAGCQDLTGPQGSAGAEGEKAAPGPISFSVGSVNSEPYTDLSAFSSALGAVLEALPKDAGDSAANPANLKIEGLRLSQRDHLYALYAVISRYTALDLKGCMGTIFAVTLAEMYPENKAKIVSVALPDSVGMLESGSVLAGAFMGFTGLKAINMSSVKVIGGYAFSGCTALEQLEVPGISVIGNNAFDKCTSMDSLTLPNLEFIYPWAFHGCTGLTEITLGASPPAVSGEIFWGVSPNTSPRTITLKIPSGTLTEYTAWTTDNGTALCTVTVGNAAIGRVVLTFEEI